MGHLSGSGIISQGDSESEVLEVILWPNAYLREIKHYKENVQNHPKKKIQIPGKNTEQRRKVFKNMS